MTEFARAGVGFIVRGLALLEETVERLMFQLETLSPMSLTWAKEVEP